MNPFTKKIIDLKEAIHHVDKIAEFISKGAVVALPTDTIYGLGCSIYCENSVRNIRVMKGRAEAKPMAICIDEVHTIPYWCSTEHLPQGLLNDLLPGPVTLLLPQKRSTPNHFVLNDHCSSASASSVSLPPNSISINSGVSCVGVRIPDCEFLQLLIKQLRLTTNNESDQAGHPLVLTSANLSGFPSALRIEEFSELWNSIDLIINGGPINESSDLNRAGSTIIDLCDVTDCTFNIVRQGSAYEKTMSTLVDSYGLKQKSG